MKQHVGWNFPDADAFMVGQLKPDGTYQRANLDAALRYVTDWRCALDGGAHIGTWSKRLAERFETVVAFEPSPDTFECLTTNLSAFGLANVQPRQAALGARAGFIHLALDARARDLKNTGARYAVEGGDIPVLTIDSLELPALGFLKLDIEGSEVVALEGAQETLDRCKPIVLFENKFLWRRYNLPRTAPQDLLKKHGYRFLEKVSCDEIHGWGPA